MLRPKTGPRPPVRRPSTADDDAIRAWLEKNQPTRCETRFAAPSQLAAVPTAAAAAAAPPTKTWSRTPRQDIEAALDEIARLHRLGLSSYAIGKRLKCDHRCVEYRLKRLGLKQEATRRTGEEAWQSA